ncbi:hypothetical protein GQ42DRAFT_152887 [Ramicandelaber brevisporus]|nr:hypothetical protein GQ42DRAFT_152887 [Ramicandelaber brevisporus]
MRTLLLGLALSSTAAFVYSDVIHGCKSGHFCVWTKPDYKGHMFSWTGDDKHWKEDIFHKDASWANNVQPKPDVKGYVKVFSEPDFQGNNTVCLGPGDDATGGSAPIHQGASHKWVTSCLEKPVILV